MKSKLDLSPKTSGPTHVDIPVSAQNDFSVIMHVWKSWLAVEKNTLVSKNWMDAFKDRFHEIKKKVLGQMYVMDKISPRNRRPKFIYNDGYNSCIYCH
jgi:hypothetical protein